MNGKPGDTPMKRELALANAAFDAANDEVKRLTAELERARARNAKLEEFAKASVAQSKFSCPHYEPPCDCGARASALDERVNAAFIAVVRIIDPEYAETIAALDPLRDELDKVGDVAARLKAALDSGDANGDKAYAIKEKLFRRLLNAHEAGCDEETDRLVAMFGGWGDDSGDANGGRCPHGVAVSRVRCLTCSGDANGGA